MSDETANSNQTAAPVVQGVVICDLPVCKYCGATPYLSRQPGDDDKYYALRCPTIDCIGHQTLSAETFPWDTIEQAAEEWIEANLKPCLKCGGAVRIVKTPAATPRERSQKFIHCDSCAWHFSPAFSLPDAELAIQWNSR